MLLKKLLASAKNPHFQSLFGNAVMALLGMVTFALLYRVLSVHDIGVYLFLTTVLALVDTVKSGFLTTAFIKFYAGTDRKTADEIAGSAWSLALALSLLLLAANAVSWFFASYADNPAIIIFLKYFSIISLANLPFFMANIIVQGEKRFDRLLWMRLVYQVLFTGSIVVLLLTKKANLDLVIWVYVLSNLIASIIILFFGWTMIEKIRFTTTNTFWQLFHFGKYSMGTSLSANLFAVTDTFFINFFLGPAALAVYNLGGKMLQIVEMPLLSFAASGMPELSAYYNNNQKQDMVYLMKKLVGMLSWVIGGIAVFSVIFANPIIALIGGQKYVYTEAPQLFRLMMCMAILYPADRFFALTLDVIHKPKVNFYKILVMVAVNFMADYIGLQFVKSVYIVALANFFPLIAAIVISYRPLNAYVKLNFWNIYVVGFKEMILLIKSSFSNLTSTPEVAGS